MNNKTFTYLTEAPIARVIKTLAIPSVISMMVTSIYNIADTYFVSQLDTQSTAAIGIVFTVMAVFQTLGFFFGQGSGSYISIKLGARDYREAQSMAISGLINGILVGVIFTITGMIFIVPICRLLGATLTIMPYAVEYLYMILFSGPFIIGSFVLNIQIRQQGKTAKAMLGMMSGLVLNIILDPLFIFVLELGVKGAGVATLVSQIVSFIVLLLVCKDEELLSLRLCNYRFKLIHIKNLIAGGSPSLTRQGLAAISTLILNISAATFGDSAIAAMTIVSRISFLVYSAITGLGHGLQPLCCFCYGAKRYERVEAGYWFCVILGTGFLLILSATGYIFSSKIIALFRSDVDVIAIGDTILRWQIVTYPLGAVIILSNMLMQSINRPVQANLLAGARRGLLFIPLLLILPRHFGVGGLIACQPLADVCAFIIAIPVIISTFRTLKQYEVEESGKVILSGL